MHLLFIKLHLIVFEVISLALFCTIFISLFYYAVIYKSMKAMQSEENIDYMNIVFSANYSKGVFADVDMKIYDINASDIPINNREACILYSKYYYEQFANDKKKIIQEITGENPYNIFLFENCTLAENFVHRLLNLKTESSTFNLTLFALISLFLIFLKITLLKDSIYRLKKIKSSKSDGKNEVYTNLLAQIHPEEYALSSGKDEPKNLYYNPVLSFLNPINVYYYIIFNLTVVIIIPLIFPDYIEYYIRSYFGFMPNMSNSVYYGRSLFGKDRLEKDKEVNLYKLIVPLNASSQSNYFMMHDYLNLTDYVPTNINPYMVNLLIMCCSIWLSQLFHPFNSQTSVKIVDVDLKKGKLKKYMKIGSIIAVFTIWGYFIIRGLIYIFDMYYLFHRLLFNNFERFFDIKIPAFILLFYYHIFFYAIMILYTYQTVQKNKKYVGNQKVEYSWFT